MEGRVEDTFIYFFERRTQFDKREKWKEKCKIRFQFNIVWKVKARERWAMFREWSDYLLCFSYACFYLFIF